MRSRSLALGVLLASVPSLILCAGTAKSPKKNTGTIRSAKEAKAIAERETGGRAVTARRIPLNGASGGWEVDLRVPGETRGWRCVLDSDTRMVHSKTRIDQPGGSREESPIRSLRGTR
ncbi:hypothetical protein [Geothrix sp. 21YS21S-4]|uniref:hypothetical protein n=1 Tax=Geothrix sp. 21YS21S-4 TaxID=3068889 RepID=UPI0027B8F09D|nr:hypothetical protein [Geothrix sp. 21YS21S-4]